MRLIDADALIEYLNTNFYGDVIEEIKNFPIFEEIEKPFITECRNTSIEKGLPLYFVYYEETGVLEIYKTDTKELFEKRHCVKYMPAYEFQQLAIRYLDEYSDWKGDADMIKENIQ